MRVAISPRRRLVMISSRMRNTFVKALWAISLVFGIAFVASTNAQAQCGRDQRDDRQRDDRNREAYKQSYRQGFTQGYQAGFQRYGGNNRGGGYGRRWPW